MNRNMRETREPGQERIFSIKEMNRYIKMQLESDNRLQGVWIRGEISNFVHHGSGHMYFTMKDEDSRLKCVMFAKQSQTLPFMPRNGAKVIARGAVSVYERDGQYQFYVQSMQPDGIGSLYLAYEQLKQKLEAEGLFTESRKRRLPAYPRTIGLITSPTGAAVRDMITTLRRRYPQTGILLYPVLVQGSQAAASIAHAIMEMNRIGDADVLIVGRGGGSLEELWAFNEEVAVRAIAGSAIPIISAVGHETDFTLADFAADLRAATPTAAAELAVPHQAELRQQLTRSKQRIEQALLESVRRYRDKLQRLRRSPVFAQPHRYLLQRAERVDRLTEQMAYRMRRLSTRASDRLATADRMLIRHNPREQARQAGQRAAAASLQLKQSMIAMLKMRRHHLTSSIRHLDAISPLKVMQRGYSLVYDEQEHKLMNSIHQLQIGDIVKIRMTDGRIGCHVWSMEGIDDGKRQGD